MIPIGAVSLGACHAAEKLASVSKNGFGRAQLE